MNVILEFGNVTGCSYRARPGDNRKTVAKEDEWVKRVRRGRGN